MNFRCPKTKKTGRGVQSCNQNVIFKPIENTIGTFRDTLDSQLEKEKTWCTMEVICKKHGVIGYIDGVRTKSEEKFKPVGRVRPTIYREEI